jgi:ATP-dependent RNA helicase CshB
MNELTKIQEQALPYALNKKSLIITSQTGTGKTLCYLLPLLNALNFNERKVRGVILLPTKELARQVASKVLEFKSFQPELRSSLIIGNQDIHQQIQSLKSNPPQIVVGTVSRILELIKMHAIKRDINVLVLDEADMLIDLGFNRQVNEIFELVNSDVLQKIACSATTHYSLANHLKKYLGNTKVITASHSIWSNQAITHNLVYSNNTHDAFGTLLGLINTINPYFCIIFANTKNIANDLYEKLLNRNLNVALLHKDLSTRERKNVYREINAGRYQYLVATDLASRGLNINGVDVIISYGLPEDDI